MYPKVLSILKYAINLKSDEAEMLPGVEVLSTLYLDAPKAHTLLEDINIILPQIKRSAHRYSVEYFLQKALVYWMFARPQEFVFESQNDTPLCQRASDLFDFIYSCNADDRRRLSTWNLLGLLISFIPSAFNNMEISKSLKPSKVRSSFKLHSNKKQAYFATISSIASNPQQQVNDVIIVATKHIIKAGSILQILAPSSPIVSYSKSLYPVILPHLFAAPSRSAHIVNLSLFQSTFVTSFSVLNPKGILSDVYPMIKAKDEFMFYTPSILQGHINLNQIFIYAEHYVAIMDKIYKPLRAVMTETTVQLRFFESQPNFSTELSRSKIYANYVATISKGYIIFAFNPAYFIQEYDYNINFKEDLVFMSLVQSTLSINPSIEKQALEFTLNFLHRDLVGNFGDVKLDITSKNPIFFTYMQCGSMAEHHAERLLEYDVIDESAISHLKLIIALLESRCNLIQLYSLDQVCNRDPTLIEPKAYRQKISCTIETAMYVCLCSGDTAVCKLALETLNGLVQEAVCIEDLTNMSESVWSILPNFAMHSEFSSVTYVLTGSVAVQKRLYQFLQHVEMATPAIITAWNILIVRWRSLTREILADSSVDRASIKQWRSYAGFLCSVLSPHLTENDEFVANEPLSKSSKEFLSEMIGLLISVESPFLRETAREVLARDTSHLSYHFIFKSLEENIVSRLKGNKHLHEQDFLLLEQSVMLLRSVISMGTDGGMYLSVDVGALALTIVKCLDSLTSDDRVIRLRSQYCHLFELIAAHRDTLNMKHDLSIRNEIVTIFSDWLDKCISSRFADDTGSTLSSSTGGRSFRKNTVEQREVLQKSCICAIIQAFTVLLLDLRIDPPDSVHEMDIMEAKSQKFCSLFTLFLRILEKCRLEEDGITGSLVLGDHLNTVKAQTIGCASKLLNANMDVGLKYALPLGFKGDSFIRVSFIKILKNILSHGSKESAEATESQRYQELTEFMISHINITLSLCDVCPATEVDEFAKALLNIFDSKGKCLNLVKAVVNHEVEKADAPLEILRRNCVATKILSIYAHSKGLSYLQVTLGSFMRDLVAQPELYIFESNPDKLSGDETPEANFVKFDRTLKKLIDSLQRTVVDVPNELREICNTIACAAGPKFPGSKDNSITAISAFFFLRFICPALVTPEGVGLLDTTPSKGVRRTLLVLAKIIQNMAFGSTSFVKISIFKLHPSSYAPNSALIMQFLKNLSVINYEAMDDKSSQASSNYRVVESPDVDVLHRFLYQHWEDVHHKIIVEQRLKNVVQNGPRNSLVDARRSTIFSEVDDAELRASQNLTSLVRNLGRPRSLKSKVNLGNESIVDLQNAPRLQELLSRNAHRDMGPIIERRIFNEGLSKEGMPLLIMTSRNYRKDEVDTELVLCRYFQVASKMWKQKFAIVYDGTGYSPENAFPTSARSVADLVAPEDMIKNLVGVFFLNVSSEYLPHLKSLIRHYYSGIHMNPSRVPYEFLTTSDIPNQFNSTVNLDPRTLKVINDVRIIFNNVYRFNPVRNDMTKVTIKLGNECIQIRSQEPFTYIKTSPGFTNDIFHLSQVTNVYASNSNSHPDEFTIQLNREDDWKIVLHCSKGYEIIRAILNAKTRLPAEVKESKLVISPETSLAPLLNIALSGLCSENAATQVESYNLMAAIQRRFKLDVGMELHGGKGLRLPTNVFNRIKMFSQKVATARPDITLEMFKYIFEAFSITSEGRRQGVLLYAIPWVDNLAKHVLTDDDEQAAKAAAMIIRKFLDISILGNTDYMFLLQLVWPLILNAPQFIPIVIDEIVFLLIDNGIQSGSQLDDTVSILASNPSVEVCRVVLQRIRSMLLEKIETGSSIVQHSQWREFVIHITLISAILFENPACVEEFFPQLAMCVLMFLYTGPYWFRKTVYNMVVNIIHSFLYSDLCDAEKKKHVYTIWDELTGSKGNMIFGISEEMKYVEYDYPVNSLMFQIDACSVIIGDLAASVFSSKTATNYRMAFVDLCLEIASQKSSLFQSRAIIIMGCAAQVDVVDHNVSKLLDIFQDALLSDNEGPEKEELLECITFCIAKVSDGLRLDSKYLLRLFWLSIALLSSHNKSIFNYALQLLQTTLKNLAEYGAFKNTSISAHLLSGQDQFKNEWTQLEKLMNISFSAEYFEVQLCAVLLRGLERSTTRAATLGVFEVLLSVSARDSSHLRDSDVFDGANLRSRNNSTTSIVQHNAALSATLMTRGMDEEVVTMTSSLNYTTLDGSFSSFMPYLVILYMGSRTTNELKDYLWIAGFPEEQLDGEIPTQIKRFLASDKSMALICMYLGALIFRASENDEAVDARVLACLRHIGTVNTDHFFKVYFTARPKVQSIVDTNPSLLLLKSALDVAKCALCHLDDLSRMASFQIEMDKVLSNAGLNCITHANEYGVKCLSLSGNYQATAAFIKKLVAIENVSNSGISNCNSNSSSNSNSTGLVAPVPVATIMEGFMF